MNISELANNIIPKYLAEIQADFLTGRAREHTYRSAFKQLIEGVGNVQAQNEPSRSEHGSPDFLIFPKTNANIILCYAETKDIGVDLDQVEKTKQLQRYFGYSNLILTNYLEFRFFQNGERIGEPVAIANLSGTTLSQKPENFTSLVDILSDFLQGRPEQIKNGKRLAEIMGGKARRIRDNVFHYLEAKTEGDLSSVYETIKKLLVHDITPEKFADMYAQTLVYGLFVARYYDESPDSFTRQEARDLIPASNPFLRQFFDHIAGPNFDRRLNYIVSELCEVFKVSDAQALMTQYFQTDLWGEEHGGPDPVIHFYEDFLREYNPELRKKIGAYYTPLPVVHFIVRAVDKLIEEDFRLARGLADTTKSSDGVHRVQVLDPAVGTGTFLSAVIDIIHRRQMEAGQKGGWPTYVHHELLPRIYGFELMMASYTIAHLKISMKLQETGFKYFNETRKGKARLGVYLTNSLEDVPPQQELFAFDFGAAIAEEAKDAAKIKNEKPIMVILGNPPYSISSSNKGEWIQNLIKDYKKDLGERKINLDDDYIKFIRFAEHFIEKNGSGIVAMITNNSFIDGITHRQMRKHLLETFDDIYILDLHGNSKKKEKSPDGGKDENVFDIQQGVSINIFVKTGKKKAGLGVVHHAELYGKRADKFKELNEKDIETVKWKKLDYSEPYYFFVPKDFSENIEYDKGFKVSDAFITYSAGVKTKVDNVAIDFYKETLLKRVEDVIQNKYPLQQMINKFNLSPKTTWEYNKVLEILDFKESNVVSYDYRPFDSRFTYYDKNFLSRSRSEVMDNFFNKNNIGLETSRNGDHVFISKNISDEHFVSDNSFKFPLYLYIKDGLKVPNLKKQIVDEIEKIVGKISSEDIFNYIYAVLHSLNYRKKYKEFLKIDFPRVPYPKDKKQFFELVKLGEELRKLHLMESDELNHFITTYPETGNDTVEKVEYKDGKVYINKSQYFGAVPKEAWEFYIGGYQPAQKWLKDRRGRILTNSDIEHYQKIIVALFETEKIIKNIDKFI